MSFEKLLWKISKLDPNPEYSGQNDKTINH